MAEGLRRGSAGMKSIKDMASRQDGPPPGGFPSIRYGRRIPNTGPSGVAIFGIGAIIMGYGFYKVGQTNHQRRDWKREKLQARMDIMPVLQAEEDVRFVEAQQKAWNLEAKIMKDVPNWKVGERPYKTRWMPPNTGLIKPT
uniref:NADH dehydrogenase [ubiquinone] 1 alpha subcomplex subunit 13 n=1 Tax=Chloropicon laureae TaxID=464258 RepID=A0A7S2Z899_9CHLO|mmetsp:Transcript_9722/g.19447  ORF Transcript_9722/g.19447 Transcript_9722/m.19447 type:complete len:141 (+) Transcript_9722:75-497(+)